MALVTLAQSFRQLRLIAGVVDDTSINAHPDREEVEFNAEVATGIVLDYIKDRDNSLGWTSADAPAPLQAAILLVLSDLWEHRAGSANNDTVLSETVTRLLHRWRDPALA